MAQTPDAKGAAKVANQKESKVAESKVTAKPAKKSRKRMVVALAVFVLAGAGGGAWWWMNRDAGTAQASVAATRPPVFMNLEPFTVNLNGENGDQYLQTSIVFQVADEKVVETMKAYLPVIRNRILLLLSGKRPSELASNAGKAKLVEELTVAVRESIPGATAERGIVTAYLGAFVIQ